MGRRNRQKKGRAVSGWINLDKPLELTSTQAVGKLRWLFQAQKAGHAGTLDPLATGILPIALGEATKTVSYLVDADKEYEFTLQWGAATTTDDTEGAITKTSDTRPTDADIMAIIPRFIGDIEQTPPAFSAIKINGNRAYDLARAGAVVALKPRHVHIKTLDYLGSVDANHARFRVVCGKGTYIRALARDMGAAFGAFAHVTQLRRTRVGNFSQKTAITLVKCLELGHIAADTDASARQNEDFATLDALLLPVQTVLDDIPALPVTAEEAQNIKLGRSVMVRSEPPRHDDGRVYDGDIIALLDCQAVAIGFLNKGRFQPARVFNL